MLLEISGEITPERMVKWLDGITALMDVSLSELQELGKQAWSRWHFGGFLLHVVGAEDSVCQVRFS